MEKSSALAFFFVFENPLSRFLLLVLLYCGYVGNAFALSKRSSISTGLAAASILCMPARGHRHLVVHCLMRASTQMAWNANIRPEAASTSCSDDFAGTPNGGAAVDADIEKTAPLEADNGRP